MHNRQRLDSVRNTRNPGTIDKHCATRQEPRAVALTRAARNVFHSSTLTKHGQCRQGFKLGRALRHLKQKRQVPSSDDQENPVRTGSSEPQEIAKDAEVAVVPSDWPIRACVVRSTSDLKLRHQVTRQAVAKVL